jgi:flagellar assembly protein FliH
MALKIIKPGTTRSAIIQQFLFSDNQGDRSVFEERIFPEFPAPPPPVQQHVHEEPPKPAVDLAILEKTAYGNGFAQGEKAGREIAEKKVDAVMRRYAESILELGNTRTLLYAQIEKEVVRLAVEVAKKIVHREIYLDKDIIQTLVRVALGHVSEKSPVTIHLNPVDYGYLLEERANLSQSEGRDVTLLADNSIERGGCLVKTDCGDVDARIEEKFKEVEQAFFGVSK